MFSMNDANKAGAEGTTGDNMNGEVKPSKDTFVATSEDPDGEDSYGT